MDLDIDVPRDTDRDTDTDTDIDRYSLRSYSLSLTEFTESVKFINIKN